MWWRCFHITSFYFHAALNAYTTCTWKTTHLVKLWHSNLPHYLGLTPTSRRVGLILAAYFPSGPRPCCSGLPTLVFQPNRKLCLVRGLSVSWLMFRAPFLKPSFVDTCAAREYVKLEIEPNPTLRFSTQATMGAAPWWSRLGPRLGEPLHLKVRLEWHVTLPHFKDVNILVDVFPRWPP
jgi:hypothetical protein